jgi:hypothetical protein
MVSRTTGPACRQPGAAGPNPVSVWAPTPAQPTRGIEVADATSIALTNIAAKQVEKARNLSAVIFFLHVWRRNCR